MAKRKRPPAERFYDRVSGIYDTIYDGKPYWEVVFELTWRHMKRFLPRDHGARCLDVGCGTGRWGLKLAKSGYRVDFLDISIKMLDQVRNKMRKAHPTAAADYFHTSIDDLDALPREAYAFVVGQGDPLNCAAKPERAMKGLARLLAPGGVMVMSVDNRYGALRHFLKDGDVAGLAAFLKNGRTTWVTDDEAERYPVTMFTPEQIRRMCAARGLELCSLIAKTALPLRRFQDLLKDKAKRAQLIKIEEGLHAKEAMFGCAAHLEFVARRPLKAGSPSVTGQAAERDGTGGGAPGAVEPSPGGSASSSAEEGA